MFCNTINAMEGFSGGVKVARDFTVPGTYGRAGWVLVKRRAGTGGVPKCFASAGLTPFRFSLLGTGCPETGQHNFRRCFPQASPH